MDLTRVLWRMERRGMFIDTAYLRELLPRIDDDIAKLERDINRTAGRELANINQVASYFFGPKDQGGLGLKPLKMTKGGQSLPKPCVDKEVMAALAEATEVAPMILELRQRQKMRSTYITALLELAEFFEDGRIHPSFNQMGARTGRLSSKAPNSQNFPRPDGDIWGIRKAFVARPGYKLIVSDYEQIEMRIMADCSGDKVMVKAIREGKDLHAFTVSRMVPGVSYEEVVEAKKVQDKTKLTTRQKWLLGLRQDNKPVGFGIIYGAGPQTISKKITILAKDIRAKLTEMGPHKVARKVSWAMEKNPLLDEEKALVKVGREAIAADKIQAYLQVFPGVKSYMEEIVTICGERKDTGRYFSTTKLVAGEPVPQYWGFVQTLLGRYRRLPEIVHHSNKVAQGHAEREAINTTIQGTAADIMSAAMIRIDSCPELNRLGVWLLNQIHDELVLEVPEKNAEAASLLVRQYMEHPLGDDVEALCVPIPVDLKIVDKWSQAK
jgi:DNA polymerase-1